MNSKHKEVCSICQKLGVSFPCGICRGALCKNCEHFQEPDSFTFLENVPEYLKQAHYCPNCFEEKIAPALGQYEEKMKLAREVNIFLMPIRICHGC